MSDKVIDSKIHAFSSNLREGIVITGVLDVISFDDSVVIMETSCGSLAVEGEELHVTVLNVADGKVDIDGKINGVYYFDNSQQTKRSIFGRRR